MIIIKLIADLHTHTIASGHAYSTINEMVLGAKKNGIKILGMTDHGPCMPRGPHIYHFANLKIIPKEIDGVKILRGVEANITDINGTLDLPVEILARLDIVLVGFHTGTGYESGSKEDNTRAMINAIKNPLVDIVVHPGNPEYQVDIKRVIMAAKEENVLLELNNSSHLSRPGSKESCIEIAQLAKEVGLKVVLGTDAHYSARVGTFDKALEIVKEAQLEEDDILNTSLDKVEEFIRRKSEVKRQIKDSYNV
nr:phosphatase [Orenia metallireducens]